MNKRDLLKCSTLMLVLGLASAARADPCPGPSPFTDVNPSDSFCTNTEWLANRSITLGCATGMFCPSQVVTRAQLAIFMNRFATALAPATYYVTGAAQTADFASPVVRCQTASIVIGQYPRVAHMISMTNFDTPTAGIDLHAVPVYSFNSGATWNEFGQRAFASLYPGSTPVYDVTTTQFSRDLDLTPGFIVRFGVRISRSSGSGTVSSNCSLRARIENRNGTGSPFDELPPLLPEDEPKG